MTACLTNCWLYVPPFVSVPGAWATAGAVYDTTRMAMNQRILVLIKLLLRVPSYEQLKDCLEAGSYTRKN